MGGPYQDPVETSFDLVKIRDHEQAFRRLLPFPFRHLASWSAEAQVYGRVIGQDTEDWLWDVLTGTSLDLAEGVFLDSWGELVLEPRGALLNDGQYRRIIRARIILNRARNSDDLIRGFTEATGPSVRVDYIHMPPAGFQLQVFRSTPLSEVMRTRIRQLMERAQPSGRTMLLVEAAAGSAWGPPDPLPSASLTSLVQAGGVATATSAADHGYQTGQAVTIAGATPDAYNGVKAITVTGSTTFTFAVAAATTSPATGTIVAQPVSPTPSNLTTANGIVSRFI